jgi:RNA polymerase sigma factor (sigma-70 family)
LVKAMDYRILHALEKQGRELPLLDVHQSPEAGHSLDELLPTQLSPEEKQLLKLFYEDNLSYQELSALLGVPPATCGTRLHRARLKCKRYLEKGGKAE